MKAKKRICTQCGAEYAATYPGKTCGVRQTYGPCGGAIKPDPPAVAVKCGICLDTGFYFDPRRKALATCPRGCEWKSTGG